MAVNYDQIPKRKDQKVTTNENFSEKEAKYISIFMLASISARF